MYKIKRERNKKKRKEKNDNERTVNNKDRAKKRDLKDVWIKNKRRHDCKNMVFIDNCCII